MLCFQAAECFRNHVPWPLESLYIPWFAACEAFDALFEWKPFGLIFDDV
jgi:trehalose utilization protein